MKANVKIAKKTKIEKPKITIGGKVYEMPKLSPMTYMDYLDLKGEIFETESKKSTFTRKQFEAMIDMLVRIYGGSFTVDELLDEKDGLSAGEIVAHFALIEVAIGDETGDAMDRVRTNFTKKD